MIWKSDNVLMKSPSSFSVAIEDQDSDSYRSPINASLIDKVLAKGLVKASFTFTYCTEAEAEVLMNDMSLGGNWNEWIFDEFDDDDIVMMLYSGRFVTEDDIYHFEHWTDKTFYM